ncbi:MAG: integrase-recombinase [Gemmataceae bacterium]|nr:integrase-recombinase [Gemmataceae bacterium]
MSTKWYGCWKECSRSVRVPLCADKSAAQVMLADILRSGDRTKARMVDPFQPHLDRTATEHVDEYLESVTASGKVRPGKYLTEKRRILTTILTAAGVKRLADLTADRIDGYMGGLTCSAGTKRVHHTAVNAFAVWLLQKKRLPANPLLGVARPQGGKVVRKRRALNPDELQRLITAARERPLHDEMYKPRGRSNKGRKTALRPSNIAPAVRERMVRLGRERALLYKTAIYTGLRKNELTQLRVRHLNLDRAPYGAIDLPGEFTKNGDDAKILLVPALAEEMKGWITDTGRKPGDHLFDVPTKVVPPMKLDLKRAGIEYRDEKGRFADFHALRKSAGTMLGVAGVPMRVRQLFMRHGDIRLTMSVYDDAAFSDMEEAVKALEKLNLK